MRFHLYCPQWEEMNDNDLLEVTSSEDSADEELKQRRERHNFHRTCVFFQKRFHKGPLSTPFCKFQSSTNPWTNLEEFGETHRKSVHVQTKVWKSWKETPRPTEKGSVSNNVFFHRAEATWLFCLSLPQPRELHRRLCRQLSFRNVKYIFKQDSPSQNENWVSNEVLNIF